MKHRGWKEEGNKKGKRKSANFVKEQRRKRPRKRKWAFRRRMQLGKNLFGGGKNKAGKTFTVFEDAR